MADEEPHCAQDLCEGCGMCAGLPGGPHGYGNTDPPHRLPQRSPVMIPGLSSNPRHVTPAT